MKRILSIILSLVLLFSVLPLTATAEEADVADTGAEELSIIQQPANCYIYNSQYNNSLYKPYLRFSVAGATANTTYEWYYDLDDEYAVGEKIATTKVPELQVNKIGWYRCWVKDTNGQSVITQSALVRETSYLAKIDSKSHFRINGTMLQWKESPFVDAFGYVSVRYTLEVYRHDNTHDTTSDLNFNIQYFSNGNVRVKKFSGNTIIGDFSKQYPATFDSTKKIFSMDLRNIIGQDQSYSDITYRFRFYTNVFNGDFATNIIRDEFSQAIDSGEYTAEELYNGEVYYNIGGQYDNEVWIEDKEYTVGDTLYANIYGGRWADKFPSVKWQRVDSHGDWLDTGTIGKNYTVTDADVVNERINRIRCVVIPYIGRISGEVYYDDEIFVSNAVDVKKSTCTVTFNKNGGTGTMNPVTVNKGSSYTLPECTFTPPANKQFKNWKIGSSYYKAGDTVTVNSNITAYAQWEDAKYTVTFDPNGGTGNMAPVKVKKGTSYKLPECGFTHPNGNQFKNWMIGSYVYNPGDTVTINSDTTVLAQWKGKYTITYNRNGGTGTMASEVYNEGDKYVIPACRFTPPSNMIFGGWLVDGKPDSVGNYWNVYSDHVLKPQWIPSSGIAERVDITVTAPKAGEKPSYDATVTGAAKVMTENEVPVSGTTGVYTQYKGISWRDLTIKKNLRSDTAFVDGHTYRLSVDLKGLNGTKFNFEDTSKPITKIYINGKPVDAMSASDTICTPMCEFVCSDGSTVSGSYTSFNLKGYNCGDITIALLKGNSVKYSTKATAATGSYSIPNVANGAYTLRVSRKNHVTRDYSITVSGNTKQDVKIHPIGDVDGDGAVNNFDYGRVNSHARNKSKLTDYAFLCADVDGDGAVNNFDAGRVNSHARGKSSLWK